MLHILSDGKHNNEKLGGDTRYTAATDDEWGSKRNGELHYELNGVTMCGGLGEISSRSQFLRTASGIFVSVH